MRYSVCLLAQVSGCLWVRGRLTGFLEVVNSMSVEDDCEDSTELEPTAFALITERETPSYREGATVSVCTYSGGHGVEPSYTKEVPLFTADQFIGLIQDAIEVRKDEVCDDPLHCDHDRCAQHLGAIQECAILKEQFEEFTQKTEADSN